MRNRLFEKIEAGLTLLGVVISIFIAAVSLVGILVLSQLSIGSSSYGKTETIAAGLAQEGIEIAQDIRKSYFDWNDFYAGVIDGDYLVQYNSLSLLPFAETPLRFDSASGLYQYGAGNDSSFYRKVSLDKLSSDQVKVAVEVKWRIKSDWHYLTLEEDLWNWK